MDNQDQLQNEEEYDYNREPPLDSATVSANRKRSKYVFMTLCFLLALALFYTYLTHPFANDSSSWFPLCGALILAIMGVVFLRSPDSQPTTQPSSEAMRADGQEGATEKALSPFEKLVQEALATIPTEFQEQMENVMVRVAYEPDEETLARVGANEGHTLLGLYEGVPLTVYGRDNTPYLYRCLKIWQNVEKYSNLFHVFGA